MLGKLLKYDLKALGRVLLPVQLGALVVGLMATFVLTAKSGSQGMIRLSSSIGAICSTPHSRISILDVFLLPSVFSSYFSDLLLIARHFYTTDGDEGYLASHTVSIEHLYQK